MFPRELYKSNKPTRYFKKQFIDKEIYISLVCNMLFVNKSTRNTFVVITYDSVACGTITVVFCMTSSVSQVIVLEFGPFFFMYGLCFSSLKFPGIWATAPP